MLMTEVCGVWQCLVRNQRAGRAESASRALRNSKCSEAAAAGCRLQAAARSFYESQVASSVTAPTSEAARWQGSFVLHTFPNTSGLFSLTPHESCLCTSGHGQILFAALALHRSSANSFSRSTFSCLAVLFLGNSKMSTDIRLCSECRKIDFESLFFLPHLENDSNSKSRFGSHGDDGTGYWWTRYKDLDIGSLRSVARRWGSCDLCALVLEEACDTLAVGRDIDSGSDSDEDSAGITSRESSPVLSTSEPLDPIMCPGKTARSSVPCSLETL